MHHLPTNNCFILKGTLQAVSYFVVLNMDSIKIEAQINDHIKKAPKLLNNALIILDFCDYKKNINTEDFNALVKILTKYKMRIIGFNATDSTQIKLIQEISDMSLIEKNQKKANKTATNKYNMTNKTVIGPIRSGQQVSNLNGDLIIIGSVNSGAELIAAGSIHIYGKLAGKCIAGYNSNKNAMIFCQSLNAELISISNVYQKSAEISRSNTICIIYLNKQENLVITNY